MATAPRAIDLHSPWQQRMLSAFLATQGLSLDALDYAVGIFGEDDELLACGGHDGDILKDLAVSPEARGENLLGRVLSAVMAHQIAAGHSRLRVFTKPENVKFFTASGFYLVESASQAALLENVPNGVEIWLGELLAGLPPDTLLNPSGALVMNVNPFTKGHLHLVRHAAQQCGRVFLFVVEEDRSAFPFAARLDLARRAVAEAVLANVSVLPSGPYMISAATFPGYFLKDAETADRARSELDARLFARRIAPGLGIERRFAGTEPACAETRAYNETLAAILPEHGIRFDIVPRLRHGDAAISASAVLALLVEQGVDAAGLEALLCPSTLAWLRSPEGRALAASLNRHPIPTPTQEEPCPSR